jgi:hypothetical protein
VAAPITHIPASALAELSVRLDKAPIGRVRGYRIDGRVLEGTLNTISAQHVSVLVGQSDTLQQVPVEHIRSLAVEKPRRGREYALVCAGGAWFVGGLILDARDALPWGQGVSFALFFLLPIATGFLIAETKARAWFATWERVLGDDAT